MRAATADVRSIVVVALVASEAKLLNAYFAFILLLGVFAHTYNHAGGKKLRIFSYARLANL